MKRTKTWLIALFVMTVSLLFSGLSVSYAAGSVQDGWVQDGDSYFYYENGQMVVGEERVIYDESTDSFYAYYFDQDGRMATGWYDVNGFIFYAEQNGHILIGMHEVDGETYFFNWHMHTNHIHTDGSTLYFFGEDGKLVETKDGVQEGWNEIAGRRCYYENGSLVYNTFKTIDGFTYFFWGHGVMAADSVDWISVDDAPFYHYCFDKDGHLTYGWYDRVDEWGNIETFYSDEEGHVFTEGILEIDGETYFFNWSLIRNGLYADNTYLYYIGEDGKLVEKKPVRNGWNQIMGVWYYYENGELVRHDWRRIEGKSYYFEYDGRMLADGLYYVEDSSNEFYFGPSGAMETGWKEIDNCYMYFGSNGKVTGLQTIGKKLYYFNGDGALLENIVIEVNGTLYQSDKLGVLTKVTSQGWVSDTYYVENNKLVTGWKQLGGTWYYFNADGTCVYNTLISIGNKNYCFDANGKMQTGWIDWNGSWYYAQSGGALVTSDWEKISGVWYYFDEESRMATGLRRIDGVYYRLDPISGALRQTLNNPKNKWVQNGTDWYYINAAGNLVTGSATISGQDYWFDDEGKMLVNNIMDGRYYGASGAAVKNQWISYGLKYLYADKNGQLIKNDWKLISSVWYYFDNDYYMVTGDYIIDGKLYTFKNNGAWTSNSEVLNTGWKLINGHWYYYKDGAPLTGLQTIGGVRYYFSPDMVYNSLAFTEEGVYYANADGAIVTKQGWYKTSLLSEQYVYVGSDGRPVDGVQTIDGKTYMFSNYEMGSYWFWYFITEDAKEFLEIDCMTGTITKKPASSNKGWSKRGLNENNLFWAYSNGNIYLTGYQIIDGKPYFFETDGVMEKWNLINRSRYNEHFMAPDKNGVLHTNGWIGDHYLRNGIRLIGDVKLDGKYYYFTENSQSVSGLHNVNGTWYYYDGLGTRTRVNLKTGLNNIYDKLVYYMPGQNERGVFNLNGSFYYQENGIVATNRFVDNYYAGEDGKLVKGWMKLNETWYYFDENYQKVTGVRTIGGKQYTFNGYGQMLP